MTTVNRLYDDLEHIDAMKAHLVVRQQQYSETTGKASESQRELYRCRDKLDGLRRQAEKQGATKERWLTEEIAEAESEYHRLEKETEQLLRMQHDLNEEITLQQKAIANNHLLNHITLKEVLEHQDNINQAAAEIERLNQLINDQTPAMNALITANWPLNSLLEQKEDILADIAAGTASEKELDEINRQIEQVQATIERAQESADRAKAAKIGLERKLEEARHVLAELQVKSPGVLQCLFYALAEEEGRRYFKMADELQKSFTRLTGLHELIQRQSPKRIGIFMNDRELNIPGFKLESARHYMSEKDRWFFNWNQAFAYSSKAQDAFEVELQALRKAGVTII